MMSNGLWMLNFRHQETFRRCVAAIESVPEAGISSGM